MVHGIGTISGIIVIVKIILIMNVNIIASTIMAAIITTMVIVVIVMINSDRHYCKSCEIRRIISVIIRRIIRHISRRIDILHDWRRFNYNNGSCCRNTHGNRIVASVGRIGSD